MRAAYSDVMERGAGSSEAAPCRLLRVGAPYFAVALAVESCARHEAFSACPFGHWTKVLIG